MLEAEVEPGVYRHSKTGNLYTALVLAEWGGESPDYPAEGTQLSVYVREDLEVAVAPTDVVLHAAISSGARLLPLFGAVYCGRPGSGGSRLVVYVGHYDNPRGNLVYVRPEAEWLEDVRLGYGDAPRFSKVRPSGS